MRGGERRRRLECAFWTLEACPELRPRAMAAARRHERTAAVREAEELLQGGEARIFRTEQGHEIWDTEPAGIELFVARLEAGVPLQRAVRVIGGWGA